MVIDPAIFRDYDIRAVVPDQLDAEGIRRIAQAIVYRFNPSSIQVGRDMRLSSPTLHRAFIDALVDCGVNVVDLGLTSTDMLYFAAGTYPEDMAITVSASHNPPQYNGLKMVKRHAVAISGDSGIYDIRDLSISKKILVKPSNIRATVRRRSIMVPWMKHLMSFFDRRKMKAFNVVVDAGNGMAGHFMPSLEKHLPWKVTRLFYKLDGTFPNHVPSPIEPKNMQDLIKKVNMVKADVGMAFDGDGDRVFLVDENGKIISGTIMTAIIAENLLSKTKGETILYNAIVGRVVPEVIKRMGGKSKRVRVGHTLIKEAMRRDNALFCGEHSGHYYFRDNFFADSAIIAALLVVELMSAKGKKLSELAGQYDTYPSSGELNFQVADKQAVMKNIERMFTKTAKSTDWLDGVSVWFDDWWFNVRPSNTEPLLRLNVEADNEPLLRDHTDEIVDTLKELGAKEIE